MATVQEYSAPISYLLTPIQGRCHITLKFTSAERTHTHTDTLKLSTLWIWKSDKQKGQDLVHTKAAVLIHSVQKYTQTQATSTNSTKPTENPIQGIEELRRIDQCYRAIRAFTSEHVHFTQRLQQWLRVTSHMHGQADFVNTSGLDDMTRKPNKKRNKIKSHKRDH